MAGKSVNKKQPAAPPQQARKPEKYRKPVTLFFALGCLGSLVYLYLSGLPLVASVVLALIVLVMTGFIITNANGFVGSYGLYLYGSQHGVGMIEWLSKRWLGFWKAMAEWGLVMGFGLISYFIFRGQISKKMLVFGIASNLAITLFLFPYTIYAFKFINIPLLSSQIQVPATFSLLSYSPVVAALITASVVIGGLSLFLIGEIASFALLTLQDFYGYGITVVSGHPNPQALSSAIPGIAPLIPGVTLPLVAGILSLALVIVVHEFSHGVLARIAKLKVKQVGLILFGILPFGAFVEPDEKKLQKLDNKTQNAIFVSGISSNLIFSVIFGLLTIVMLIYVVPNYNTFAMQVTSVNANGTAANILTPGTIIYSWDGYLVNNLSNYNMVRTNEKPLTTQYLVTSRGNFSIKTNSTAKIGITPLFTSVPVNNGPGSVIINFIYSFVALSFVLNFLIGAINLLPVPSFDGWRIYKTSVKNPAIIKLFTYGIIILLLISALPWLKFLI
jgi:membrane-associated protease RseP (regulator of RpoE activity)